MLSRGTWAVTMIQDNEGRIYNLAMSFGLLVLVGNLTRDNSLHFPEKQFLLDALLHWGKHLLLELKALAGDQNLICLQLLESGLLLFGHFLERDPPLVCQSIELGSQVRFDWSG